MNAARNLIATMLCVLSAYAWANESPLQKVDVAIDVPTMERGAQDLMETCHSCHSLKYIKYRDLVKFGIAKEKVDAWRGDQPLDAELLAQMSDADSMQSFGKSPPDLSLMVKARDGGSNYVYSYLLGYYLTPEGTPGNHIYPETKMPDALDAANAKVPTQRTLVQGRARDIVSFLAWVADPHAQERTRLGYFVLAYLMVLTTLLYFVKKQVWTKLQ